MADNIGNNGKLCSCGTLLPISALFCSQCGKRWEEPQIPQTMPEHPEKHRCPCCKLVFPYNRMICPVCDIPLTEEK